MFSEFTVFSEMGSPHGQNIWMHKRICHTCVLSLISWHALTYWNHHSEAGPHPATLYLFAALLNMYKQKSYIFKVGIWYFGIHKCCKNNYYTWTNQHTSHLTWLLFLLRSTLSQFQICRSPLSATATMLCIRPPWLIPLMTACLCPLTNIFPLRRDRAIRR